MANDKPLLAEIDDDDEIGYLDKLRKKHFEAGAPILYKEHDDDEHYIYEFPDGKKQRLTLDELKKLNDSET